jgi:hypothetical protein
MSSFAVNPIQPFEILQVEASGILQAVGHQRVPTDEGNDLSNTSNTLVSVSTFDGHRINHEETLAIALSTRQGLCLSEETDRKVLLANYDTPNFSSPTDGSMATNDNFNIYGNASAPTASSSAEILNERKNMDLREKKVGGYFIPEYKSIYDDPSVAANTAYEYKSIYDD